MAVATAWLETVYDESPRLSYRVRSEDTLASNTVEEADEREQEHSPRDTEFSPEGDAKDKAAVNGGGVMDTDGEASAVSDVCVD